MEYNTAKKNNVPNTINGPANSALPMFIILRKIKNPPIINPPIANEERIGASLNKSFIFLV